MTKIKKYEICNSEYLKKKNKFHFLDSLKVLFISAINNFLYFVPQFKERSFMTKYDLLQSIGVDPQSIKIIQTGKVPPETEVSVVVEAYFHGQNGTKEACLEYFDNLGYGFNDWRKNVYKKRKARVSLTSVALEMMIKSAKTKEEKERVLKIILRILPISEYEKLSKKWGIEL